MAAGPVKTFSAAKNILKKDRVRLASHAKSTAKLEHGENGRSAPKVVDPVQRSGNGFSTAHFMVDGNATLKPQKRTQGVREGGKTTVANKSFQTHGRSPGLIVCSSV